MGGALVISLDFELRWGVREGVPLTSGALERMRSARLVVRELLARFEDAGIAATWATVGLLFAGSRQELAAHAPAVPPSYADPALDPFREPVGEGEASDPAHYARSLVEAIGATPRQEIASHTYSHFYCPDDRTGGAAFDADLASAVRVAASLGVELRSIVFPRNQVRPECLAALPRHGIRNYRGNALLSGLDERAAGPASRALRLVDAYLPVSGPQSYPWSGIVDESGLRNVRASMFLRAHYPAPPLLTSAHLRRVVAGMRHAAGTGRVFHLWWHPHNFADDPPRCFAALARVLEAFDTLREVEGMRSLTMDEAGDAAAAG